MAKFPWWQTPNMIQGHDAKRVTWLELFFDLIFVVVISHLAHHLSLHPTLHTLEQFAALFFPVWWTWVGITYYNERFETFDLSFRVLTFLQLLGVAAMAANVDEGLGPTQLGFALSYAYGRTLLAAMWWRAGWYNPGVRSVTTTFTLGYGLSAALWVVGAFVPAPLGLLLKGLGLLSDIATPLLNYRAESRHFSMELRKLPERFGLFVIIVLGESLTGVVNGLSEVGHTGLQTLLRFGLAMLLGFGMWWIYFDFIGRREPVARPLNVFSWAYLHLPLLLGIVMVSAMTRYAIAAGTESVPEGVRWILSGGIALYFLAIAVLEYTVEDDHLLDRTRQTPVRLVTALAALCAALLPLPIAGLVALQVALLGLHMLLGLRAWFGSDNAGRQDVH